MVEGVRWAESGFKILNKHEETKKKSSQAAKHLQNVKRRKKTRILKRLC